MNAIVITLIAATAGYAHPLGNDTIAHFSILHIRCDRLELDLVLDIGETPALILHSSEIDLDHDHNDTVAEQEAWLANKASGWAPLLQVTLDEQPIRLEPMDQIIDPMTGRKTGTGRIMVKTPSLAGMWTYKVIVRYAGAYLTPLGTTPHTLSYTDTSFPDHRGMMRVLLERTSLLFRLRGDASLWAELRSGSIPQALREMFERRTIELADDATLTEDRSAASWLLTNGPQRYSVEQEDNGLNVYRLPRVLILAPRPPFWDESPVSPFIYEQYDLSNLPQQRSATIQFRLTGLTLADPQALSTQPVFSPRADLISAYLAALNDPRNSPGRQGKYRRDADRLIGLLQQPWGLAVLATVTVLCFGWGAAHALMPGHAKTLVAAYLISQRGTWRHAVCLAFIVTVTHTALVVLLGVVIWIYQKSNPTLGARLQLWLGILAGLLVAGMGLMLVWRAATGRIGRHQHGRHHHEHTGHDDRSWFRRLLTHSHPHPPVSTHAHPHTHEQGHRHEHTQDAEPITIRLLLVLGVTGGIVPCPTATIIMLLGIGANVVLGALYAIAVFSLGLALTLMAIGILALGSRKFATRLMSETGRAGELSGRGQRLMLQVVPALSGLVVFALGGAIATHYIHYLRTGLALFRWIQ